MYNVYLYEVFGKAKNSYDLVKVLKKYKAAGYDWIYIGRMPMEIGRLMQKIVTLSKKGYSLEAIENELIYNYSL